MQHTKDGVPRDSPIARLYELHATAIFAYLRRQTPSREDAEDILVEVFAAAVEYAAFDRLGEKEQVAWQPRSHNLAFAGATSSGGKQVATLEIWNATTGKLVTHHVGAANGALAWSPDGTYLAYADYSGKKPVNVVIIMDATTGKQIYVYKEHRLSVSVIAWSPNGKYVVSAEGNTEGQTVAKVWTA